MPLSADQADTIRTAAIDILARIGMGEAPPQVVTLVCNAGGSITENGRLLFPVDLVERCLAALPREVTLCGQADAHDLVLAVTAGFTLVPAGRRQASLISKQADTGIPF
jgi:trimethylamine--corrinoid protein Co-methyltransferase